MGSGYLSAMNTTPPARSQPRPSRSPPGLAGRSRLRGFAFVELLVGLAIVAVLIGVAAPSVSSVMDSVKLGSVSDLLMTDLRLGRSEAIKRDSRVVLCKSADGESCASSGGWEQGWIIFADANNNAVRDASESIIRREAALSYGLSLTGNQSVATYVSFAPTGGTKLIGGGFQAGTLTICKHSFEGGEARQIVLNAVGRARAQKSVVPSC